MNSPTVLFAAAITAAFFFAPAPALAAPSESPAISAAVDDAVARYRLPGIAVGVLVDGEVSQVEVRGELEAGSGEAVDRDTIFKIASNSKAMTAALLARLVDAGKLAWDDPVVKHLPGFRMHEDWVTREIQVRDLLIHNSGLGPGAGDLMLWPEPNAFTREDVIAGLAHLKPRWSFRSRYAYDNTLYIVAGEVAAAAGGASYAELMRREVFAPLGLERCRVGEWNSAEAGNVARPHARREGRNVAAGGGSDLVADMPMAAAGGIACSLDDMLTWARMWLQPEKHGLVDGKPWLSQAQREAAWTAHMPMPLSQRMRDWDGSHFSAYGYGWRLTDVDGTSKVSHTGTLSGMYSALTLLPEKGVGFVLLINGNADEARTVLNQVLVKQFTAPQDARTVAYYADALAAEHAVGGEAADGGAASQSGAAARTPADPEAMKRWLGVYRDPWLGEASVCRRGDEVRIVVAKSPRLSGRVMASGGRMLVEWDALDTDAHAWLDFSPGEGDGPTRLAMAKVDPDADFSYDFEDLAFLRVGGCTGGEAAAAGMVDIATLAPGIDLDIRYAGSGNFTGAPVDGYEAPRCYLLRPAAEALARVELALRREGHRLRIFDCYRPMRAVRSFVRWAADTADLATKAAYYPAIDKDALIPGYISDRSGHSRGATVDLTLMRCEGGSCEPLDMGTPFDFFDARANIDHPGTAPVPRRNRDLLRAAMESEGFANYPMEWWHYTLAPEPLPATFHDFPVQ